MVEQAHKFDLSADACSPVAEQLCSIPQFLTDIHQWAHFYVQALHTSRSSTFVPCGDRSVPAEKKKTLFWKACQCWFIY